MPKITELYAWVVADTGPDDEGVPAFTTSQGALPMMGADMERAVSLRPMAVNVAQQLGRPVKLIRSTGIEIVEIIQPEEAP